MISFILNCMRFVKTYWLIVIKLFFITLPFFGVSQIQKGQDIDGEHSGDWSGKSISMPDPNTLAIGSTKNSGNGNDEGHVRVFTWNGANWNQKGADITGEVLNEEFGWSIDMPDSNIIAIGAPKNDGNGSLSGSVKVYQWDGNSWLQKGQDLDGEFTNSMCGMSVSMPDQNTLAVGSPYNPGTTASEGQVRVYEWNGSTWVQKGQDINGSAPGDLLGFQVDMPNNRTLAVSSTVSDQIEIDGGHVAIYEWNTQTSSWAQKGSNIIGSNHGDNSGFSISMPDEATIAIGSIMNSDSFLNAGHVRIFKWNGNNWIQKGSTLNGSGPSNQFGYSVSMPDSNTITVGAPFNDEGGYNSGAVRIFQWNGIDWVPNGVPVYGEFAEDLCGTSVSMPLNNTFAAGGYLNDENGLEAGHVRVYSICPQTAGADIVQSCGSYTWIDGINYTSSTNSPTFVLTNSNGCDSTVTLHLTVGSNQNTIQHANACDSITWINGQTYYNSVVGPSHTLSGLGGCDSTIVLDLSMFNSDHIVYAQSACNSFTWIDGITYTETTNAPFIQFTNQYGCDSIVSLDLTINNIDTGVSSLSGTLTATNDNADYQWVDCLNNYSIIPNENNQSYTPLNSGSYAVVITDNECIDTSLCQFVNLTNLDYKEDIEINIFPNPADQHLQIEANIIIHSIEIKNTIGQQVYFSKVNSINPLNINMDFKSGIYYLIIKTQHDVTQYFKVIRE